MKSAPAVMVWAMGLENLTTPAARPGNCFSRFFTWLSRAFLPVPRITTWGRARAGEARGG